MASGCGAASPESTSRCSGAAPSLAADVAPIVVRSCSGSENCHGAFGGPTRMHDALVDVQASEDSCAPGVLVAPGDPGGSYLVKKLTGIGMCPQTQRMPLGGSLSDADIQVITDWICVGAPND